MLAENGTAIFKLFLHISKDEQKERLTERIRDPEKRWKFDEGDLEERKLWDSYMKAFEGVLSATSTPSCALACSSRESEMVPQSRRG